MTEKRKLAVVVVGGNALIRGKGKESLPDQYAAVCLTMPCIVDLIQDGWSVIVTHGNGPQVGSILRFSELSVSEVHPISTNFCSNTKFCFHNLNKICQAGYKSGIRV